MNTECVLHGNRNVTKEALFEHRITDCIQGILQIATEEWGNQESLDVVSRSVVLFTVWSNSIVDLVHSMEFIRTYVHTY